MGKIRNLIYNTSDLVIAVIIILAAALLIWFRVEVIMDYPDNGGGIVHKGVEKVMIMTGLAEEPVPEPKVELPVAEETGDATEQPTASNVKVSEAGVQYIEVTIPSGCSSDVVSGLLKQAGLITETNDFLTALTNLGYDGAIMPGKHNIPLGSSMEDVVKIVCGAYAKQEAEAAASETPAE